MRTQRWHTVTARRVGPAVGLATLVRVDGRWAGRSQRGRVALRSAGLGGVGLAAGGRLGEAALSLRPGRSPCKWTGRRSGNLVDKWGGSVGGAGDARPEHCRRQRRVRP